MQAPGENSVAAAAKDVLKLLGSLKIYPKALIGASKAPLLPSFSPSQAEARRFGHRAFARVPPGPLSPISGKHVQKRTRNLCESSSTGQKISQTCAKLSGAGHA